MFKEIAQLGNEATSSRGFVSRESPQHKANRQRRGSTILLNPYRPITIIRCRLKHIFRLNWKKEIFLIVVVETQLSLTCRVISGKEIMERKRLSTLVIFV